jgi:hypothetical protein
MLVTQAEDRVPAARAAIRRVVADRAARGNRVPPAAVQATAAALLVDLWAAAERHGVPPDSWGWHHHLPQAALNTVHAAHRYRPTRRDARTEGRR